MSHAERERIMAGLEERRRRAGLQTPAATEETG